MPESPTAESDDVIELSAPSPDQGLADDGAVISALRDNVVLLLPGVGATPPSSPDQPMTVRLREALDASNELILVIEPSGRVLFANQAARIQLFAEEADPIFRAVEPLLSGTRRDEVWPALERDHEWRGDLSLIRADGSTAHLEIALLADDTAGGDIRTLTVIAHDVGEQRALQDALDHRVNHDGLTGLANRQHLLRQLNDLLADPVTRDKGGALLVIDVDEFRTITNSLGHETGDRVLVAFAYRLLRTFPTDALLARVGGDEFAVFYPGEVDIDRLAEQIGHTTSAPFFVDGSEVHLSVVTGIAVTHPDQPVANAEALLREADAASYRAKERGHGAVELFEPTLQSQAEDRLAVVQDLRRAIRDGEFHLHYQPKVALGSGAVVGAEALIRWRTPDGEMRPPATFMDVAEDTGLVIPMGQWVLEEVCRAARDLQAITPDFQLSLNVSVRQIDHPSFADDVENAVATAGLDPSTIELEITESALMEDVETSAALLTRLKQLGTTIAVDDFGTGYSSLQYLQRLPVDVLKVDRSFVSGLDQSDGDLAIVRAVVQLADALGLTSVAEGVESAGQLEQLRALGCRQAQGYLFARPVELPILQEMLRSRPRW